MEGNWCEQDLHRKGGVGEGTTPLLEGLAWVTSLCVIYLFFSKIKKKHIVSAVSLNTWSQKGKKKEKKTGIFGQRKIKPVGSLWLGSQIFGEKVSRNCLKIAP